jgi:hypothetical protein
VIISEDRQSGSIVGEEGIAEIREEVTGRSGRSDRPGSNSQGDQEVGEALWTFLRTERSP